MATKLNTLRQAVIDATASVQVEEAAHNALQDQESAAKAAFRTALKNQRDSKDGDKDKLQAAVTAAEAEAESFAGKLSAQRKLVSESKKDLASAQQALEAEQAIERIAKDTASGSGLEVSEDHADKLLKDPKKGFRSHREFLVACINDSGHRSVSSVGDERLRLLAVDDKTDKMAKGELAFMLPEAFTPRGGPFRAAVGSDEQGGYDDRYGGFAVTRTLLPGVLQVGFEGDPTAGKTQPVPMATPVVDMIARTDKNHTTSVSGGFTVTRRPETVAATSSRETIEMVSLKATSLFGLAYATEEILTDSVISFIAIIEAGFRDQFGAHLLNEKLRGLGGSEFTGVLTGLDASNLGPTVSVAKETGQAAATVYSQNIIKMAAQCWGFGNAIWLANHDTRPQLFTLSVVIGTGGVLLYQPSRGDGFPDMMLGRPVFYTEYAAKVGTVGDVILGNWSQYLEGLYQPLQSAESMHVRFVNHERTFKFWLRNAGAPWWRAALTPNQSTTKLSPFVVLATRA